MDGQTEAFSNHLGLLAWSDPNTATQPGTLADLIGLCEGWGKRRYRRLRSSNVVPSTSAVRTDKPSRSRTVAGCCEAKRATFGRPVLIGNLAPQLIVAGPQCVKAQNRGIASRHKASRTSTTRPPECLAALVVGRAALDRGELAGQVSADTREIIVVRVARSGCRQTAASIQGVARCTHQLGNTYRPIEVAVGRPAVGEILAEGCVDCENQLDDGDPPVTVAVAKTSLLPEHWSR